MKLIFVYNADSDFASSLKDAAHKIASPTTYQCNLCRLTYPLVSMDKEWKKFVGSLPYESVFLHRDEFRQKYPAQKNVHLPAVFAEDASGMRVLINADEINKATSVPELIKITQRSLPGEKMEQTIYRCPECGLRYRERDLAARCEAWCKEHKSCNLDIIKDAIKDSENKSN